ncbi:MAG: kynureninase [Idiomarina sp.]
MITKQNVLELDSNDPISFARDRFYIPAGQVYLDGNSLGLMSHDTHARVAEVTNRQWGKDAITSWNRHNWIGLPQRVGKKIAALIGAAPGQVICCDSISVNLFKALAASLTLVQAKQPQKNQVLSTSDNFPTDLYMVQGLQQFLGNQRCELVLAEEDQLADAITASTAVLLITEVNFRTGRRLDVAALITKAHAAGAMVIVDLAHSAGVLPVDLDAWQADFAVGCTYKYLNGGPGAPAFIYAAERHHAKLQQPLVGWMGHQNPFEFTADYSPAPGISQFLAGTPPVLSMSAVDAALDAFKGVNMGQLRFKSMQLSELCHDLVMQFGLTSELTLIAPKDPNQRGSQLSYESEHAYGICQALIERDVIADFRSPNYLRFGFAPLYNSFHDVYLAVQTLADVIESKAHLSERWQQRNAVT